MLRKAGAASVIVSAKCKRFKKIDSCSRKETSLSGPNSVVVSVFLCVYGLTKIAL